MRREHQVISSIGTYRFQTMLGESIVALKSEFAGPWEGDSEQYVSGKAYCV